MSRDSFRYALASRLGEVMPNDESTRAKLRRMLCQNLRQVLTPEIAALIETECCPYEIGYLAAPGVVHGSGMLMKIDALIESMLDKPQVECQIREHFAPGLYAREITIPKGVTIVGAVHKTQNMAVLSRGCLRVVTDDGTMDINAHHVMTIRPGCRNAVFALEDSVWTNYHPTTETDPDKLVEMFTYSRRDELGGGSCNPQLLRNGGRTIKIGGTS